MPTTQQLREQRANVWSQMTEIMELADTEKRELTGEEETKYDAAEADLDALEAKIVRQESHEKRSTEMKRVDRSDLGPGGDPGSRDNDEAYLKAFASWMAYGSSDMDVDERKVLRSGFIDPKEVQNAAGVATGGAGGYTVPPLYRNAIIEHMVWVASMRQVAETITTDSGAALPWPTVDDTMNEGAIVGENTQIGEQDVIFGTNQINAWMYTSKLVRVSLQLLTDTGFDLEGWLKKAMGTRIARVQNRHFTAGTGVNQPLGAVTGATVGKIGANGQTSTIIYEDLIDLEDALDPAYLGDGSNLSWMMSQLYRKNIRKLKDLQNHPLWEPSVKAGTPDALLGHGIVINNNMPVPAASAKTVLFGDLKQGYLIRDVKDFFLVRFGEKYMDQLQVGFAGFQRSDGTVQNAYAYTAFQQSAT